uniref:Uncharacterized protein n=1 Tax=Peronospora matthiolae TaxID=2874970 RepID=A0AAV1T6D3_9STRA
MITVTVVTSMQLPVTSSFFWQNNQHFCPSGSTASRMVNNGDELGNPGISTAAASVQHRQCLIRNVTNRFSLVSVPPQGTCSDLQAARTDGSGWRQMRPLGLNHWTAACEKRVSNGQRRRKTICW